MLGYTGRASPALDERAESADEAEATKDYKTLQFYRTHTTDDPDGTTKRYKLLQFQRFHRSDFQPRRGPGCRVVRGSVILRQLRQQQRNQRRGQEDKADAEQGGAEVAHLCEQT